MNEDLVPIEMSYVLSWHPYSRANDLIEEFGEFSKELEVVARSRGGNAAVDLLTGKGVADSPQIAKTIIQSIVFSMTDIYELCLDQAEKIEKICQVTEHDMVSHIKGLEKGERVTIHFGPIPEIFDSLCEFLVCSILRRALEMWMAVQYVLAAGKISDGDLTATVKEQKRKKFLSYIATELSEEPLIVDDDLLEWINTTADTTITFFDEQFNIFKGLKSHRVSDFLFMINWKQLYVNIYSELLVISEIVYTSFGSSNRWDDSPLILPIIMLSSGAVAHNRTILDVFNGVLPENCPKIRAHKRLMLKLFPS
ncbi:hypothetical protein GPJ56_002494 [Histomonas meleagridis]|uniref:uncharacterized protein n=1 Tax=Histomonas meleagridis TaxID=135588 RepID=UPI0035598166|nr:hypothetical protein GPJ56_002494 [Histomonas meleagridis]KAH0806042.1 hypothetical protein GO595_001203 [Histomonas meleagridis]